MSDKEAALAEIARDSLKCIESVAAAAESALKDLQRRSANPYSEINANSDPQLVNSLRKFTYQEMACLSVLIKQPVIARVHFIDDNGKSNTIYITRTAPPSSTGFTIASYRAPVGRIASLAAGHEYTIGFGNTEREVIVESSTKLKPQSTKGEWDSKYSEVDILDLGRFTVKSLRELLLSGVRVEVPARADEDPRATSPEPSKPRDTVNIEDDLEIPWDNETNDNIEEGVRRAILTQMALRDQPILDRHQDEIFRMPINTRCFLSGPPGTGKTTTLVRRLGLKTDRQALENYGDESRLIRDVEEDTGRPHEKSWILFSPTELLRQYVKEAFNREGLAASDRHIRTWAEFRQEIARDELGLLRTSTGNGPFVERREQGHLKSEVMDDAEWYDDFRRFLDRTATDELRLDAEELSKNSDSELGSIFKHLANKLKVQGRNPYRQLMRNVEDLVPKTKIREAVAVRADEVGRILTKSFNEQCYQDRNFSDLLRQQVSQQLAKNSRDADLEDELEAVLDDEGGQVVRHQADGTVSRRQARLRYERALKSFAKYRSAGRRLKKDSQDGMLVMWLGRDRIPSDKAIARLGNLLNEQTRLRKFERLERLFIRGIPARYKRYRTEMAKTGRWYTATPKTARDIHWRELDLVVLATLQIAIEILDFYRGPTTAGIPSGGLVATIRQLQRAQILVDEATDFSQVQLACMQAMTHPKTNSFFLCGDINQRLTSWGLKSNEALDWLGGGIDRRSITVSYRQSRRLVDLAKQIAAMGGSQANDIVLPDRLDTEGLPPVWRTQLSDNSAVAEWLSARIREIDQMVQKTTTIAVLVNNEAQVEPLAVELNNRLEEISLHAVACKDGKAVGNDRDVRVFNIRHIKGMEFEAVFFVDLDKTVSHFPALFSKYLYVGATRAATYLGVTFHGNVPRQLMPISHHFREDWSLEQDFDR